MQKKKNNLLKDIVAFMQTSNQVRPVLWLSFVGD